VTIEASKLVEEEVRLLINNKIDEFVLEKERKESKRLGSELVAEVDG